MYRDTKTQLKYDQWQLQNKDKPCIFCFPPKYKIVNNLKNFWILKNEFAYTTWDNRQVVKHLMVTPKKHLLKLEDFSKRLKDEYLDIISKFEKDNYDIYTKGNGNISKSIRHIHTHLIKCRERRLVSLEFQNDPYVSKPQFE